MIIICDFKISIKAARVNANLTQSDVCDALHISKTTLVHWEKNNNVNKRTLIALCELYKIPDISYIFLNSNCS